MPDTSMSDTSMPDADVVEQLGMYGAWLELHEGVPLRPGSTQADDDEALPPIPAAAGRRRRGPLLIVAAAAVAVLVAGLVVGSKRGPGGQNVTAYVATDPPGALYVLPEMGSGIDLTNGHAETSAQTGSWPIEVVVVGMDRDGTIGDMASIRLTTNRPQFPDDWVEIETPGGRAEHGEVIDHLTAVTRLHGERWLTVYTGPGQLDAAILVLDGADVATDGEIELSAELTDLVVERISIEEDLTEITTTYAEVRSATSTPSPIVVETATAPSPLISVGVLSSELSRTTVQGVPGWRISSQDRDGAWNGITWQASPNRMVAVSGHAPIDEIAAVAEALHIVDEETWTATVDATG